MVKILHNIPPIRATNGVTLSEDNPADVIKLTSPVLVVQPYLDEHIVYALTKAIHESYNDYKDLHPNLVLYKLEDAIIPDNMVIPFHEGAVKYFKEIGWWNQELEEKQQVLLDRQAKYKDVWNETVAEATEKGLAAEEFPEYWLEKRSKELVN